MNPQQKPAATQSKQRPTNRTSNQQNSSSSLPGFVLPALAVLAVLGAASLLLPKSRTYQTNLKDLELRDPSGVQSQKVAAVEAPRYGLRDVQVREQQVHIILRDNGAEDGDHVTLTVNGQVYAPGVFLRNAGNSVLVPLNPGPNLVQIRGDRDGGGGITLAADVSTQGNMTNTPFPQGGVAMFYIVRR